MKKGIVSLVIVLALALVGCNDSSSTLPVDDGDTPPPAPAPALSCTIDFGSGILPVPTAEQLTAYAGTYIGLEYNSGDFSPNGNDAVVEFSDAGTFTYNDSVYTAVDTCYVPADSMIYLTFPNGAHVDLFVDLKFSGISPADDTIVISNLIQ